MSLRLNSAVLAALILTVGTLHGNAQASSLDYGSEIIESVIIPCYLALPEGRMPKARPKEYGDANSWAPYIIDQTIESRTGASVYDFMSVGEEFFGRHPRLELREAVYEITLDLCIEAGTSGASTRTVVQTALEKTYYQNEILDNVIRPCYHSLPKNHPDRETLEYIEHDELFQMLNFFFRNDPEFRLRKAVYDIFFEACVVAAGADVDSQGGDGGTPLHRAAGNGSATAVAALVAAGADVNSRNGYGQTPLHIAAGTGWFGNATAVSALVAAGANVDARDGDLSTSHTCIGDRVPVWHRHAGRSSPFRFAHA